MPNRLQSESSPYLLQHVDNPVDWHPWGTEAFDLAKRLDKPIFLSIGYAACHWCHVMAHESFEDPDTAALMNQGFVNIKVDREERPDVDTIYMNAVVAITGQGGWPLSAFLTPEGKPFYGGTYFPPSRRYNMPSFKEVLQHIQDQWENDRERIFESGETLTQHLHQSSPMIGGSSSLDIDTLNQAAENLFKQYDWQDGGWGAAPKFPASSTIETLLRRYHRSQDQLALDMATHVLGHMRRGGIYDQIGGGFHRYSVDSQWLVPHFEKMLYDNALLIRAYLHHWQTTQDPGSRDVVEQTIEFLMREMRDESGGFYASLDADSEGEEGTFYLWDYTEFLEVTTQFEHPDLAIKAFGVTESGNFEGRTILTQAIPLVQLASEFGLSEEEARALLGKMRADLLETRGKRPRPATDDKVITAWNGLLLVALAEAARVLQDPSFLRYAQELAHFTLSELMVEGKLHRSWRHGQARFNAYLEDHAALGLGFLSLYQADFDTRWFAAAEAQAEEIVHHFVDENGGFFDTRDDHEDLLLRPKTIQDTPTPSGNAMAATLLLQLGSFGSESEGYKVVNEALASMQVTAARYPTAFASWLNGIDFATSPQLQLAITGNQHREDFQALDRVMGPTYLPNLVRAGGDPTDPKVPALLSTRPPSGDAATAYLCQGFSCQLPTQDPDILQQQILDALRGAA